MSKKTATILMIIVAVVGSIFTFFGSNLLFSDVANMGYGIKDANIITSFPMAMVFCQFVLAEIYLSRYLRRPQYVKAMTKKYLIIFMSFSLVGLITAIMSGVMIYHSFVKPYPFPAYCLVMIIVNVLFIATGIYFYILASKRMKEDETRRKFNIFYVIYTIFTSLLVYFAFERFGAFLYAPGFIEWRTFYLTWPFFVGLLVPMAMMIQSFLYIYEPYKKNALGGLIFAIVNLVVGVGTSVGYIVTGYYDSRVISAISPAMALERLQCSTISIELTTGIVVILGIFTLQYAIRMYIKARKLAKENNQ